MAYRERDSAVTSTTKAVPSATDRSARSVFGLFFSLKFIKLIMPAFRFVYFLSAYNRNSDMS